MTPAQIRALQATERTKQRDPRADYWHYRRTRATDYRDAVWQFTDRSRDGGWETVDTPPLEVLQRLQPKGTMQRERIRWQGFHDPAEYAKGN